MLSFCLRLSLAIAYIYPSTKRTRKANQSDGHFFFFLLVIGSTVVLICNIPLYCLLLIVTFVNQIIGLNWAPRDNGVDS